ncbi:diacylglycerol kinase 4-like protein [Tanacetum coccineum]
MKERPKALLVVFDSSFDILYFNVVIFDLWLELVPLSLTHSFTLILDHLKKDVLYQSSGSLEISAATIRISYMNSINTACDQVEFQRISLTRFRSCTSHMEDDVDISTLTMEQYVALIPDNIKPGIMNPKIGDDIEFEINANLMRELRRKLFTCTDNEDAYEHVREKVKAITTMGKENIKEPVPRDLSPTPFLGHLKEQMGSPYRTRETIRMIGNPEEIHNVKAPKDEGVMDIDTETSILAVPAIVPRDDSETEQLEALMQSDLEESPSEDDSSGDDTLETARPLVVQAAPAPPPPLQIIHMLPALPRRLAILSRPRQAIPFGHCSVAHVLHRSFYIKFYIIVIPSISLHRHDLETLRARVVSSKREITSLRGRARAAEPRDEISKDRISELEDGLGYAEYHIQQVELAKVSDRVCIERIEKHRQLTCIIYSYLSCSPLTDEDLDTPYSLKRPEEVVLDQELKVDEPLPDKVSCCQGVFYNYFSIGLNNILRMHVKRLNNAERESVTIPSRSRVALNLHSYASGRNPWGNLKPEYLEKVHWTNERPLENIELNAIIGTWFTLWRDYS